MNKKETVYEALTNVKREYVEEAANYDFKKRRISWPRMLGIAAAACLVVAMAAIAIIPKRERNPWAMNDPTDEPITTGSPTETAPPIETNGPTETNEPTETNAPYEEHLLFTSYLMAREFIESTKLSDAEFESYARENVLDRCGITSRLRAIEMLKNLQSVGFPILEGYSFYWLNFDRGGKGISVSWNTAYKHFSVLAALPEYEELPAWSDTFAVELEPSSDISELKGKKLPSKDGLEVYGFIGVLADGRNVRIDSTGYTREEAEALIRMVYFGTLNELIEASDHPMDLKAEFYSPAELAEFIASSDLGDEEFKEYIKLSGLQGFLSGADVSAFVNAYEDGNVYEMSLRIPTLPGYGFDRLSLGVYAKKVHSFCRFPDGRSFKYTYYPMSMSGSAKSMLGCTLEQLKEFGAIEIEPNPDFPLRDFMGISKNDLERLRGHSDASGVYTGTGEYLFFGWIEGAYVEFETNGCDRSEAVALIRSLDYLTLNELAGGAEETVYTNEWFIDTAWEYARLANEVHGYAFTKQSASQWRSGSQRIVSFHTEEDERLSVAFLRDRSGEWYVEYNAIMGKWPEDGEFDDLNVNWDELRFEGISVTKAELERAGYALSGGNDDLIAVSQYCGDLISAKYTGCSEDNALRCHEARAISPRLISLPLFSDGYAECVVRLRLRPVNTRVFTWAHGDNECAIAGADDEMPGYMCDGMSFRIERTEDGFNCLPGVYDGTVNWCNISLVDDPRGMLQTNIETILAENADSSSIESDGMWIIRLSYGMDWEWFEREYGEAVWPKLVERLKPGSITSEIENRTMCMLAMRGVLNAPEKYRAGFGEILAHQRAHDENAFSYCLSELGEQQRVVIEGIVGN
ncbi:MAG: hypothetical protein II871_02440 [Clostridia bacterium]|nr:hypothetical protein [Clostridia bacterium]